MVLGLLPRMIANSTRMMEGIVWLAGAAIMNADLPSWIMLTVDDVSCGTLHGRW